jgi:6-phosphogluconolactonase (cycloisomerase 2 family)
MASGNYLYVASNQSSGAGAIAGYSVSGSGLTALSGTDTTGTEPQGLAEDSTGSYVMAVSTSGTLFDGYSFTSSSGALGSSPVTSTTIPSAPIAIVAVP